MAKCECSLLLRDTGKLDTRRCFECGAIWYRIDPKERSAQGRKGVNKRWREHRKLMSAKQAAEMVGTANANFSKGAPGVKRIGSKAQAAKRNGGGR